jgi:methylglyoxal synthase
MVLVAARIYIVECAVLVGPGGHTTTFEPRSSACKRHSEQLLLRSAGIFADGEVRHVIAHRVRLRRPFSHVSAFRLEQQNFLRPPGTSQRRILTARLESAVMKRHDHPSPADDRHPRVVLIAHDARKHEMAEWSAYNRGTLAKCNIFATATTGRSVAEKLDLPITMLLSGPLGGDAQVGAMIAERKIDVIIFFWDPLSPQPHDVDVKALLRLAVLYDVPIACNRRSADMLISSPLFMDLAYHEVNRTAG